MGHIVNCSHLMEICVSKPPADISLFHCERIKNEGSREECRMKSTFNAFVHGFFQSAVRFVSQWLRGTEWPDSFSQGTHGPSSSNLTVPSIPIWKEQSRSLSWCASVSFSQSLPALLACQSKPLGDLRLLFIESSGVKQTVWKNVIRELSPPKHVLAASLVCLNMRGACQGQEFKVVKWIQRKSMILYKHVWNMLENMRPVRSKGGKGGAETFGLKRTG